MRLPLEAGTYALVLSCHVETAIQVGRLASLRLRRGFYVYVGSAFGPGGLRARMAHHSRVSGRPHWHVDYLRAHARLEEVWYCRDAEPREHQWASAVRAIRGAEMPVAGFGSSDCQCRSHLYFFNRRPSRRSLQRKLRALDREHPVVRVWTRPEPCGQHRPLSPRTGA